jgi:hypothetical protein
MAVHHFLVMCLVVIRNLQRTVCVQNVVLTVYGAECAPYRWRVEDRAELGYPWVDVVPVISAAAR